MFCIFLFKYIILYMDYMGIVYEIIHGIRDYVRIIHGIIYLDNLREFV